MARDQAYYEAEKKIQEALKSGATELYLNGMGLTELPPEVWKLTNLKVLDLGYEYNGEKNQLTEISSEIGNLTQLITLNLSYSQLTTLPDSLGQLTQLTTLDLSNNQLTTLPDSLRQLTQLTTLDLSNNQLTTLPNSLAVLGALTHLQALNLSNNRLTTLPDSLAALGALTALTYLNLSGNELTTLPEWLGLLIQLKSLEVSSNQLTDLPESLGQLTQLEDLILYENQITDIPEWLGQLSALSELQLGNGSSGNPLGHIPIGIRRLQSLKLLGLDNCDLDSVPDWVGELKHLEVLWLDDNSLSDIPTFLAQLEHLEQLDLKRNPLNPALQSAYEQGLDAVKAYLHSLADNAEPLYEAKLVLVGEGNVGKTTLLKALKGRDGAPPQEHEPTTHGVEIDIHGLRLPHPAKDGVEIQLNAWDFGGQEIYRVTHQFFFSRRSLYLLLWEPRRGVQAGQVEDWLNMIRLRVGLKRAC